MEDYSEELGDDGYEGVFVVPLHPFFEPSGTFFEFEPSGTFFEDDRCWDGPRYGFSTSLITE